MVRLVTKKIKNKKYSYLEHSFRVGRDVRKISYYLGPSKKISSKETAAAKEEFNRNLLEKEAHLRTKLLLKNTPKLGYPLTEEEVLKIEIMNLKYKKIIHSLHPKNVEDLYKRFIANYVFESNALEGNSLTLKNVAEIIFENKISQGKDLREIYDAQNSYLAFQGLLKERTKINHEFIQKLHAKLMDKIDDRLGYRTLPIMILGKPALEFIPPENVYAEMDKLLQWYHQNEQKLYPLELAFKFHALFERIHPFCDGNGRVGRFLLNYILLQKGYFPIILRKNKRNAYLKALDAADRQKWIVLIRFALRYYKETFSKFFEVYYQYA